MILIACFRHVIDFEKDFPETENLVPQVIDHLDQLGASTQRIEEIMKFGVDPGRSSTLPF